MSRREFVRITTASGAALALGGLGALSKLAADQGTTVRIAPGERLGAAVTIDAGPVRTGSKVVLSRQTADFFLHRVHVERKARAGRITVDFRFEGPAIRPDALLLTLKLKDERGVVFAEMQRRCEDVRLLPAKIRKSGPKTVDMQSRQNHEEFDVSFPVLEHLRGLELEFRRIRS